MTLFAKAGLRPAIISAMFVSICTSSVLMAGPTFANSGLNATKGTGNVSKLRPRNRIEAHPRNRNRQVKSYTRNGRNVRVIETAGSSFIAGSPTAIRSDSTRRIKRLIRRDLRQSIDAGAIELRNLRNGQGALSADAIGGNSIGNTSPGEVIQQVPASPSQGQLTEVLNNGVLRPRAEITSVSERQKIDGERKAAARAQRFRRDGGTIRFRFYRENEAYDERFPSVVYLNSK